MPLLWMGTNTALFLILAYENDHFHDKLGPTGKFDITDCFRRVDFTGVLLAAAASATPLRWPSLAPSADDQGSGSDSLAASGAARTHTFSDFPRCGEEVLPAEPAKWPTSAFQGNYCKPTADAAIFAMGYSVRSATHRYTRWMRWNGA